MTSLDASYFDKWYADMAASADRDALIARTLGVPADLRLPGVLTGPGLDEVTAALHLPPDGLLLDIACGRGGYGIEAARRTGATLIGVDFSAVALDQARPLAADRLPGRATFQLGTLTETGIPSASADAVMCIDAIQFATPPAAGLRECRRLLKPGARLVLTTWQAVDPDDNRVPARIRAVHLERDLTEAGFTSITVHDRPAWRAAERSLWEAAVAVENPDPAVQSLQDEGRASLANFDQMHRVFATATAPLTRPTPTPADRRSRRPPVRPR
ncbi:class I SAM-dependent methyltransferase [Dactylosporangium vinaceum]|uniref:Class I SAM-dependent methyltransferase n=1 Tax=Dactylosporangium vinaceum TaxID=53362 RepID=A0ABV5MBU9_9ACTN|nr:class I SAM-dependent methyltransferase [Dactylosporangium vinaceum]UAC01311.1 class I SAM-dependent methyltransferase [Dactylosporangium vinaceum]